MEIVSKVCTQCGEMKPLEDYYRNKKVKDGRTSECKCCAKKRKAEIRSRPESRARQAVQTKEHQERMDSYFASRGCTCELCFRQYPIVALDLHHLDPATKSRPSGVFTFNKWNPKNLAKITAEADGCALLCASCHRVEHEALRNGWSIMALNYPQVDITLDWKERFDAVCRNSKEAGRSGASLARAFESFRSGQQRDSIRQATGVPSGGLSAGDGRAEDVGGAPCADGIPVLDKFVSDSGC